MSLPPASKAPCTFFLPSSFACRERVNRPRRRTHHQLRLHRDMCVKRGPQPIWMEANGEQKKINRRRRRRGEMLQCKNVSLWTFSFFRISFGHFSAVCGFQALVFFSLLLAERKTMKLTHWREMEFLNMTQKPELMTSTMLMMMMMKWNRLWNWEFSPRLGLFSFS